MEAHYGRRALKLRIATLNHKNLEPGPLKQMELNIRASEKGFMNIVSQIRASNFIHSLTPLQASILETEFLSL
jgi:hypothetical protein